MRLVLIGAGRVATQMGKALGQAGHEMTQVYSRSEASARQLAAILGCRFTTNVGEIEPADAAIFMLADRVLPEMIAHVCPMHPEMLAIHTAGSMPMALFEGRARRYGVLYPMQTFSKERAIDFRSVPCFIEASDAKSLNDIRELASSISHRVRVLEYKDRLYLHLAAVFASNMANHCYHIAQRICAEHGIDFADMLPLIEETTAKLRQMSPHDAQTGPAVRGDRNVMERQMGLLAQHPMAQEIYRLMSIDIEKMHRQ